MMLSLAEKAIAKFPKEHEEAWSYVNLSWTPRKHPDPKRKWNTGDSTTVLNLAGTALYLIEVNKRLVKGKSIKSKQALAIFFDAAEEVLRARLGKTVRSKT